MSVHKSFPMFFSTAILCGCAIINLTTPPPGNRFPNWTVESKSECILRGAVLFSHLPAVIDVPGPPKPHLQIQGQTFVSCQTYMEK